MVMAANALSGLSGIAVGHVAKRFGAIWTIGVHARSLEHPVVAGAQADIRGQVGC